MTRDPGSLAALYTRSFDDAAYKTRSAELDRQAALLRQRREAIEASHRR